MIYASVKQGERHNLEPNPAAFKVGAGRTGKDCHIRIGIIRIKNALIIGAGFVESQAEIVHIPFHGNHPSRIYRRSDDEAGAYIGAVVSHPQTVALEIAGLVVKTELFSLNGIFSISQVKRHIVPGQGFESETYLFLYKLKFEMIFLARLPGHIGEGYIAGDVGIRHVVGDII